MFKKVKRFLKELTAIYECKRCGKTIYSGDKYYSHPWNSMPLIKPKLYYCAECYPIFMKSYRQVNPEHSFGDDGQLNGVGYK
jgi:hypothetical protein